MNSFGLTASLPLCQCAQAEQGWCSVRGAPARPPRPEEAGSECRFPAAHRRRYPPAPVWYRESARGAHGADRNVGIAAGAMVPACPAAEENRACQIVPARNLRDEGVCRARCFRIDFGRRSHDDCSLANTWLSGNGACHWSEKVSGTFSPAQRRRALPAMARRRLISRFACASRLSQSSGGRPRSSIFWKVRYASSERS